MNFSTVLLNRRGIGAKMRQSRRAFFFHIAVVLIGSGFFHLIFAQALAPSVALQASGASDQDDMCIWVHPTDPALSTVIASDKDASKIFVYDLDGNTVQTVTAPGKPGNIDVRYNFKLSGQGIDIVGFNDRTNSKVAIYKVDPNSRELSLVGHFDAGDWPTELYGFCLYRSPNTGKYYAIGSGKSGQMRQWELVDNGDGTIGGLEMRTWDNGSQTEGLVADDETGQLYAASEADGIYKYEADPVDANPSGDLIAATGDNGLTEDVEGITIYYAANGEGYLIASSQGNDSFKVYERKAPHNYVKTFTVQGASSTDGIDVSNVNLGPKFPNGVFALHEGSTAVLLVQYEDIGLKIDTEYWNPRGSTVSAIIPQAGIPGVFELFQNYPNPFNPSTQIRYDLREGGLVRLEIFNILGQPVRTLVNEYQPAGAYIETWESTNRHGERLPGGIYFARLRVSAPGGTESGQPGRAGEVFTRTIKMSLTR